MCWYWSQEECCCGCKEECCGDSQQVGTSSSRSPRSVYVKIDQDSDLMGADQKLWVKVSQQTKSMYGYAVNMINVTEASGGISTKTLILCPVSSRLGSNATHAMKDITGDQNMALVCFHHISPHKAFNDDSQSVLQDAKFACLGAIVDVVFWERMGVYDCSTNQTAVNKLCRFINGGE